MSNHQESIEQTQEPQVLDLYDQGITLEQKGELENALSHYKKALKIASSDVKIAICSSSVIRIKAKKLVLKK